jgi:hypothetical protein
VTRLTNVNVVCITRIGCYTIKATSAKVSGWITGQCFCDLTILLWRSFLYREVPEECKCCGIAQLSVKTTGKTYLAFIVLVTEILYYSHFLSILAVVHNFICCFSPLADYSFLGVYFLWCPHSMLKHIEVYNVKFICIFCVLWYGASVCLLLVSEC